MKICSIPGCNKKAKCKGLCSAHYEQRRPNKGVKVGPKPQVCTVDGCSLKVLAKGLCSIHYDRKRNHGGTHDARAQKKNRKCSVSGCNEPHFGGGYCRTHLYRMQRHGTLDVIKVESLPGEKWAEIPTHPGLFISTSGRVKSCRKRHEKILSQKFCKPNPHSKSLSNVVFAKDADGNPLPIRVHMEVLKAFVKNIHGDALPYFRDGDRQNCTIANLAWYGQEVLLPMAIAAAEDSQSKWADCFLKFWHGDNNALDLFFETMRKRLGGFLANRARRLNIPFYIDYDDCVQDTLVHAFIAIRRGMVRNLETVTSWIHSIAKKVLAGKVRIMEPTVSMEFDGGEDENQKYNKVDKINWCHPSAEHQAIYNEECVA